MKGARHLAWGLDHLGGLVLLALLAVILFLALRPAWVAARIQPAMDMEQVIQIVGKAPSASHGAEAFCSRYPAHPLPEACPPREGQRVHTWQLGIDTVLFVLVDEQGRVVASGIFDT